MVDVRLSRRLGLIVGAVALLAAACSAVGAGDTTLPPPDGEVNIVGEPTTTEVADPGTTTTTNPPRPEGVVPTDTVRQQWGSATGLTMFRGNPTRTFSGTGPVPDQPRVLWRFPDRPMCGTSSVGGEA